MRPIPVHGKSFPIHDITDFWIDCLRVFFIADVPGTHQLHLEAVFVRKLTFNPAHLFRQTYAGGSLTDRLEIVFVEKPSSASFISVSITLGEFAILDFNRAKRDFPGDGTEALKSPGMFPRTCLADNPLARFQSGIVQLVVVLMIVFAIRYDDTTLRVESDVLQRVEQSASGRNGIDRCVAFDRDRQCQRFSPGRLPVFQVSALA